jgi:hypothetical protein
VSPPLQTALIALVPACMLLLGSTALLIYTRIRLSAVLQVLGATGIVMVVFAHICEALGLFPEMGWGAEDSVGHYLNLGGAICGLTLFPIGYLLYALTQRDR